MEEERGNRLIEVHENGLHLVFELNEREQVKLLHFSALPFDHTRITSHFGTDGFRLLEVQCPGLDRPEERHGTGYTVTAPGYRMVYRDFRYWRNEQGRKIEVETIDPPTGLVAVSHYQFYDNLPVVRCFTEVKNTGEEALTLEYVSSFALTGIEKEGEALPEEKLEVLLAHQGWQKELCFSRESLKNFGMITTQPLPWRRSSQVFSCFNTGNWSTKRHLPLGAIKNQEAGSLLFWQIEHNGSWYWEIGDQKGHMYLQLSGPNEQYSHWFKTLQKGETFTTVPVAVGSVMGDIDEMGAALTGYRRRIRRPNRDNEELPIIFNDYMNCLFGDPTTEKELPMIARAKEAGCQYYVIDAGWYSDGEWWDGVGEWLPSKRRFPEGLPALLAKIREAGMIPGLWLELEVMGIHCPKADKVKPDWFFTRHGKPVMDRSRYQLDFRNPEVIRHADEVIDRLVGEYGVGYIKMDYNIEPGIGTELYADSVGDGLLGHNRAYLTWLEGVFRRYPDLVIENCSSGGLRMDYAMLSRYSLQSTSDIEDYRMYATTAANAPLALTPEQAAVWSYPLADADEEETIFNMVSCLLLRIHQSGHLVNLSESRFALVKEALDLYALLRKDIKEGLPFWPLGLSSYGDRQVALGLRCGKRDYLAVWQREKEGEEICLPIKARRGEELSVTCLYPKERPCPVRWEKEEGNLYISLPGSYTARLLQLDEK